MVVVSGETLLVWLMFLKRSESHKSCCRTISSKKTDDYIKLFCHLGDNKLDRPIPVKLFRASLIFESKTIELNLQWDGKSCKRETDI